jgi:hypothetical protein
MKPSKDRNKDCQEQACRNMKTKWLLDNLPLALVIIAMVTASMVHEILLTSQFQASACSMSTCPPDTTFLHRVVVDGEGAVATLDFKRFHVIHGHGEYKSIRRWLSRDERKFAAVGI